MRCICEYEYETEWKPNPYNKKGLGKEIVIKGNKPFKKLEIIAKQNITHNYGSDTFEHRDTSIYACPKCGTLKLDIGE